MWIIKTQQLISCLQKINQKHSRYIFLKGVNQILEMKTMSEINGTLDIIEEMTCELENITIETIQNKCQYHKYQY